MSAPSTSAPIDDPVAGEVVSIDCSVSSVRYEDRGGICYLIQPGDSLWRIAERIYGSPTYWTAIYEANRPRVSKRDYKILVGCALELPLVRVTTIDGVCQPCAAPAPPPGAPSPFPPTTIGPPPAVDGEPAAEFPELGEALELAQPALSFDAELVTLVFDTPVALVTIKLKAEFQLARQGSVVAPHVSLSKDGISASYKAEVEGISSGFTFDVDLEGGLQLKHDLIRWETPWTAASVGFVAPRTWKFTAGPKEAVTLTWTNAAGSSYDVQIAFKGFDAEVTAKDAPTAAAPAVDATWWSQQATQNALYGLGAIATVGLVVFAAPALISAVAGLTAIEFAGAATAGAASLLLFTDAREEFDMLEEWPASGEPIVSEPGGA